MTPDDAARLLAVAGTFDQRLRPPSPEDAEARALAWAAALHSDMPPAFAQQAIVDHYADTTDAVMPAHLNGRYRVWRHRESEKAASRRALEQPEGIPMPPEVKDKIRAFLRHTETA